MVKEQYLAIREQLLSRWRVLQLLKLQTNGRVLLKLKDNDDFKSMTGANYDASTDDAVRKQKPGYVQFIVKSQTDKYNIKAPTEKVTVADPANVTEDD